MKKAPLGDSPEGPVTKVLNIRDGLHAEPEAGVAGPGKPEEYMEYLASFLQMNPNPIIEVDVSGGVTFFNPAAQRVLENLGTGKEDPHTFLPEDLNAVLRDWDGKAELTLHREMAIKDRIFDETVSFVPQFSVARICAFDVTERKRAEEALKAAHRQLMDIIEFLPDATFVIDLEKKVIAWNRAIEEMTGVKKEDMLGKGDYAYAVPFYGKPRPLAIDLVLEWDAEKAGQYDFVKQEGDALLTATYGPMTYEGKGAHLFAKASPLFDAEGHVIGAVESIRDITEHKRIEKELRESEERYRTAIENSNDGVAILKGEEHLYVNRKYAEIFGFSNPDELIGKSICLTAHPDDRARVSEHNRKRQQGEEAPSRYEFKGVRKDGAIVHIEVSATSTTYLGETVALAYLRDVTEPRDLEARLLQSLKLEAIGTLAAGIAHDFNNILMALMGYGNLLQMKLRTDDPLRIYVDHILGCTAKGADLTQSLLAFSRKQLMELKPHRINPIVRDMEKLLRRLLTEDTELKTVLAEKDVTIMADATQIDQVLLNLAANARDAMPKGGILTVETKHVHLDNDFVEAQGYGEPGEYALISIGDTGVGIDESIREKIFEPFFTTKKVGNGTGLGLSIVYGIVKQHNGYIVTESEPGKGTTFHIYLPAIKADARLTKNAVRHFRGGTETILFAEDNPDVRMIIGSILSRAGYTVIETEDGQDAVEKFGEHLDGIDLLILDVVMPRKNGKEAYEEIRRIKPDMKALFMSGYTRDVVLDKGVREETLDYVSKPLSPQPLLHRVREILDR